MTDSRLIGTRKSDSRRTAKEIAVHRDVSASKKAKLQRFLGKLEHRYTRTRCYSRLGDHVWDTPYTVVAKDAWSAALVVLDPVEGKKIVHVHFEGDCYWITLGFSGIREFFNRVKPKRER